MSASKGAAGAPPGGRGTDEGRPWERQSADLQNPGAEAPLPVRETV